MSAEGVKTIPQCAECDAHWLPADADRWQAWLTCDEPPGTRVLLRSVREGGVRRVEVSRQAA